jgi:hypothetical protein
MAAVKRRHRTFEERFLELAPMTMQTLWEFFYEY